MRASAAKVSIHVGALVLSLSLSSAIHACQCSGEYYHDSGIKAIADLTGAKASIECRNVKLCNEQASEPYTHSAAYANVNASGGGWAQCGWLKSNHSAPTVVRRRYAELQGTNYWIELGSEDPGNGTVNEYKVRLNDLSTGEWYFYVDGGLWKSRTDSGWINKKGSSVTYEGEIYRVETDMPGTNADRCSFSGCKYDVNNQGTWPDAGLTDANMHSSDTAKWNYSRISGTAFDIWDVSPLP